MTVTSGFFDSVDGDRLYNAEQMSQILDRIIEDGILKVEETTKAFKVSVATGMNVNVAEGKGWYKKTWIYNDATIQVTVPASHPTLARIDYILIEVDKTLSVRANSIKVLSGTPAVTPDPPTLSAPSGSYQQYPIAEILVEPGVTSILAYAITDLRGNTECPYSVIKYLDDEVVAMDLKATRIIMKTGDAKGISSGAITIEQAADGEGYYTVDTEGEVSADDLATINGGAEGDVVGITMANSARYVTLISGGNINISAPIKLVYGIITLLRYNGAIWRLIGTAKPGADVQSFPASGSFTWTKPAFATSVKVIGYGAGGGGAGGKGAAAGIIRTGGSGGGGGARVEKMFRASDLTATVAVTVGAGGNGGGGGTNADGTGGSVGGDSSFGTYLIAYGGGAGKGGSANPSRSGGSGGGSGGAGVIGVDAGPNRGGLPANTDGADGISGQGGGSNDSAAPGKGEYGGGGGGGTRSTGTGIAGAGSLFAAGGGGGAGSYDASNVSRVPAAGGIGGAYQAAGGGAAGSNGTTGSGGTNGADGSPVNGGSGGGGGGAGSNGIGGNGGVGGSCGGGGGGGGAATGTSNKAGNGGSGGDGAIYVISY